MCLRGGIPNVHIEEDSGACQLEWNEFENAGISILEGVGYVEISASVDIHHCLQSPHSPSMFYPHNLLTLQPSVSPDYWNALQFSFHFFRSQTHVCLSIIEFHITHHNWQNRLREIGGFLHFHVFILLYINIINQYFILLKETRVSRKYLQGGIGAENSFSHIEESNTETVKCRCWVVEISKAWRSTNSGHPCLKHMRSLSQSLLIPTFHLPKRLSRIAVSGLNFTTALLTSGGRY